MISPPRPAARGYRTVVSSLANTDVRGFGLSGRVMPLGLLAIGKPR